MDSIKQYLAEMTDTVPAAQDLVTRNLPLVVTFARRYQRSNIDLLDLIQAGNLGLVQAAARIDAAKANAFSTYASMWIKKEIFDLLRERFSAQGISQEMMGSLRKVRQTERDLRQQTGIEPTVEEIAKALGITPAQVDQLLHLEQGPLSLDYRLLDDGEMTLGDTLEAVEAEQPESQLFSPSLQVQHFLQHLSAEEREVIDRRFGEKEQTYKEISKALGKGKDHIQGVEHRALLKLQRMAHFDG